MQPVITLFKTESLGLFELYDQLGILPDEVTSCEFFYTYTPPARKLAEVLDLLKRNKVNHAIQFMPAKAQKNRRAIKNLNPELARA